MSGKVVQVVVATILGWLLLGTRGLFLGAGISLLAVLFLPRMGEQKDVTLDAPPWARFLFESSQSASLWLAVRVVLAYEWLEAGWHKVTDPGWVSTGESILGYWQRAASIPAEGRPLVSFDWWRTFLQFMIDTESHRWFGPLVAYGELLVGIGLLVGSLTAIAAFFGAFMNWSFMMSGSASSNPMLFLLSVLIILAWRVAGWYGLDRWLLPLLGTPWRPGTVFSPTRNA